MIATNLYLIIITSVILITLTIGLLLHTVNFRNLVTACVAIFSVLLIIYLYFQSTITHILFPHMLFINIPAFPLLGAFWYYFVKLLIDEDTRLSRKGLWHFVPVVIYGIILVPEFMLSGPAKFLLNEKHSTKLSVLMILCRVHIIIYFLYTYPTLIRAYRKSLIIKKHAYILLAAVSFAIGTVLIKIVSLLKGQDNRYFFVQAFMYAPMAVLFYVYIIKTYFNIFKHKSHRKTVQTHLQQLDLQSLDNKLKQVMEVEKLYYDDDLTLKRLSTVLGVTTHQLSQYINDHYKMNYYTFLYQYRIDAAKELLVNNPEKTNLEIAYEVGFNSYTPFFSAFKKFVGCSPDQFRKRQNS